MGHWFKHDSDARNDIKLKTLVFRMGKGSKADWWDFVEVLSDQPEARLAKKFLDPVIEEIFEDKENWELFLSNCKELELLCEDDKFIWSNSLCDRLKTYEITKEKGRIKKQNQRDNKGGQEKGQKKMSPENVSISISSSGSTSISDLKNNTELDFPHELDSEECRQAVAKFVEHRKAIKKPIKTLNSLQTMLKKWASIGEKQLIQAIETSIENEWQGVFEPNGRDPTTPKLSIVQQKTKALFEM